MPISVLCVLCQTQQALVLGWPPRSRIFTNSPMCICSVWFKYSRQFPPSAYSLFYSGKVSPGIAATTIHLDRRKKFQVLSCKTHLYKVNPCALSQGKEANVLMLWGRAWIHLSFFYFVSAHSPLLSFLSSFLPCISPFFIFSHCPPTAPFLCPAIVLCAFFLLLQMAACQRFVWRENRFDWTMELNWYKMLNTQRCTPVE